MVEKGLKTLLQRTKNVKKANLAKGGVSLWVRFAFGPGECCTCVVWRERGGRGRERLLAVGALSVQRVV